MTVERNLGQVKPALLVSDYNLYSNTPTTLRIAMTTLMQCSVGANMNKSCKWSWFKKHKQPCALVQFVVSCTMEYYMLKLL